MRTPRAATGDTASRAKVLAAYLLKRPARTRELVALLRRLGQFPPAELYSPEDDRHVKKVGETLRALEALGLIVRGDPEPGWNRAANRDGLRRVARVGIARYARELTAADRVRS